MNRFLFLPLLSVVAQLWAAEPTPAPPRIDVKPTYAIHEPIVATVQGIASVFLWEDTTGIEAIEVDGGKTLHIWAKPGRYKLRCRLLEIDWEKKAFTSLKVSADFAVEGVQPEPDPVPPVPPVPPPPPPPNTKWQVAFFVESADNEDLPAGQRAILAGLKCRDELNAKGHKFVNVFDQNQVGPKNILPDAYRPWWDAWEESKLPLPCVAIAPLAGGTIKLFPLPVDQAALGKLLEKGGL